MSTAPDGSGRVTQQAPETREDPVAARAHRGMWNLEAYEISGDVTVLDAALGDLTFATGHERAGTHPDRAFWFYCRSMAHAYRSDTGSPEELADAITWSERAFADPGGLDRGPVATFLGELYWARYAERRAEPDAARHLGTLIEALTAIRLDDADPLVSATLRMMLGCGYAERHLHSADRSDLDTAIGLLEPSVDVLPPDVAEVAAGALSLCWAYHARGADGGDPGDIGLAIDLAERTITRLDPATEPRVADLRWAQALFRTERLDRDDDHLDLDEAIRCLRDAAEALPDPDPDLAMWLAELLGRRGELYRDSDDMSSSAVWAGIAANTGTDPDDAWYPRLWQANAYTELWRQRADPADLGHLVEALNWAIEAGLPDAGLRLTTHRDRLRARYDLDQHLVADGHLTEREAATARIPLVTAADQVLRADEGDDEDRSELAMVIAGHMVTLAGQELLALDVVRVRELLAIVRACPPDAHRRQLLAMIDGAIGIYGSDDRAGYGLEPLAEALSMPEYDADTTADLRRMMSMAKFVRGSRTGDMHDLDSAMSGFYQARRESAGDPALGRQMDLFLTFMSMTRIGAHGDPAQLKETMARALSLMGPDEDGTTGPIERVIGTMLSMPRMLLDGAGATEIAALADSLPAEVLTSGGVFGYQFGRIIRLVVATAAFMTACHRGTPAETEATGETLARAVDAVNIDLPVRTPLLNIVVSMLLDLLDSRPDPKLAAAARRWAESSAEGCAHPGDQAWAQTWMNLARLRRRDATGDDLAVGRANALSALQGRIWQVVLQADAEYGFEAARLGAGDVRTVTGWCRADAEAAAVEDRQPILADLVRALDAGRGMVLGVAAATGAVHDALLARGEPALAARWLAGDRAGHADDPRFGLADLRHRVVAVLSRASGAGEELFAPVTVEEIRAGLAATARDALVYLVAGDTTGPGFAVVVPAAGDIGLLTLPELRAGGSPLGWYLHTYEGAQTRAGGDAEAWRWSLSQLSSWAWRAGMGPLLGHCRALVPDRPPRLVLIPAGALSVVPWHAAWRLTGNAKRRYAIQDAVLSYAASARTWADSVRRPAVPVARSGPALIIADPTGDLPGAADEADGIRRAFYPGATYLGRPADRADGPGTPGEVLAWLAEPGAPPATVLHAACHGVADPDRPSQSHLRLAGGPLHADDLIRSSATHRRIGTVVLAACTTHVAGTEYDEALTLSTAFLIAGAGSVVGSLWAVPSASTALLMFMFHHFLSESPGDPGEALRRAQLWMLDPDRRVPGGAIDLHRHVVPERLGEPYRWAGFTHLGR